MKNRFLLTLLSIALLLNISKAGNLSSDLLDSVNSTAFTDAITSIKNHINGTNTLNAANLNAKKAILTTEIKSLENDEASIKAAMELVALYESSKGGLFTKGSTTEGGLVRTATGFELENVILTVSQGLIDYAYTQANLLSFPSLFTNKKFETSSFFPGALAVPSNANISYSPKINATHKAVWGSKANYETEDARRPTGCYLAPGSIAKVTVPSNLIGKGLTVLVGAHTWDLSNKPTLKRMDRITKEYNITSTTTTIANPLGGGIYINIPYGLDLGVVTISIQNVVRSPFYSNTIANKTSLADWLAKERSNPAPWADFESDKFMMQLPRSWVFAFNDPETLMNEWDQAMDAVSELHARPLVRGKTVLYSQVDVIMRGTANFPGYPQSNHGYNPYSTHTAGNFTSNPFLQGPKYNKNDLYVVFHELGHAEKFPKFTGEIEAAPNFLWVAVQNKKFGLSLDQALKESFSPNFKMTIDDAAITWMITENFRNGKIMSNTNVEGDEMKYQHRGYAKYADIVRLFGWGALENFYYTVGQDAEKGIEYATNTDPTDSRILRMSKASGIDLRPLIHFWGIHPINFNTLQTNIKAANLVPSVVIYDQLQYYKTLVPLTAASFKAFGNKHFTDNQIANFTGTNIWAYGEGFYKYWIGKYGTTEGNATIAEIQDIIDLYFPNGRPCAATSITAYSKINSGAWNSDTIITIQEGENLTLGPQPNSGGTWLWKGPNNYTASTRQITLSAMTINQSGNYTAQYKDAFECISTKTFKVTVSKVTGVQEDQDTEITVYPNPVTNQFQILGMQGATFELFNSQGEIQLSNEVNSDIFQVNIGELSSGVYFLKVASNKGTSTNKIIKQ